MGIAVAQSYLSTNNGHYEQLGLVSWEKVAHSQRAYGVYTNISHFSDWMEVRRRRGFSYQTKVMLGARPLGPIEHKFEFTNKSDPEVNVTNVSLATGTNDPITYNGSAIIKSNSCATLSPNEGCDVVVSYNIDSVGNHDFGIKVSTDSLAGVVTSRYMLLARMRFLIRWMHSSRYLRMQSSTSLGCWRGYDSVTGYW